MYLKSKYQIQRRSMKPPYIFISEPITQIGEKLHLNWIVDRAAGAISITSIQTILGNILVGISLSKQTREEKGKKKKLPSLNVASEYITACFLGRLYLGDCRLGFRNLAVNCHPTCYLGFKKTDWLVGWAEDEFYFKKSSPKILIC